MNWETRTILPSRRLFVAGSATALVLGGAANALADELLPQGDDRAAAKKDSSDGRGKAADRQAPVRMLFNENPLGPSRLAIQAATEAIQQGNIYPHILGRNLVRRLHQRHGLAELPDAANPPTGREATQEAGDHQIVLGNGSSELLVAAGLAYSVEGGNIVEPTPTYETIGSVATGRPGPKFERRKIPALADGRFDVDGLLAACDEQTKILIVTNPNNPTGSALADADLRRLVTQAPPHVLVYVDEAYIEYLDDAESRSAIPIAAERENVLVTRTFSKLFGMAGLRAGYAFGHRNIFQRLRPFQVGPLNLNTIGLVAAGASLEDHEFQQRSREMAAYSRKAISAELKRLGFRVLDSDAACVWAEWDRPTAPLVEWLADRNILISGGRRWQAPNAVRISVAPKPQTAHLLAAINDFV